MLDNAKLVAFVGATDAGRTKEFYGQTLGLRLAEESPIALVFESRVAYQRGPVERHFFVAS